VALLAALAAPSADAEPLTLDAVQRSAAQWFPALRAADADVEAAEGELESAAGGFDPIWRTTGGATPLGYYETWRLDSVLQQPTPWWGASFLAGWRIGQGQFAVYDGKAQTLSAGEVRAGVQVPLWRDREVDRRRAALRGAELMPKLARATRSAQWLEVRRAAAVWYWAWVEACLQQAIATRLLNLAEARDAGLAERARRGDIADLERQENLRAILARRGQVVAAQRAVQSAAAELALYLRDANGQPRLPESAEAPAAIALAATPSTADVTALAEAAASRRPERQRWQMQAEQARIEANLARNQALPAVDVQGTIARDVGSGGKNLAPTELALGMLIDVPLRTRVADGKVKQASAKARKAEIQDGFLLERILTDLRDLRAADVAARERLRLAESELALANKLATAEAELLRQGAGNALLVNLREQAAAEAEVRVLGALAELQRVAAAWQAVVAQPDP